MNRLAFAALAIAVGVALVACTEDPVVLATVPPFGPEPPTLRCVGEGDCPAGLFCEREHCDEPAGTCRPFPIACPDFSAPVCGCDGVTYFNECFRRAAGVSTERAEECEHGAVDCRSSAECPSGASCALLVGTDPRQCGPDLHGRCWVLPTRCPAENEAGPDRWEPCGPPMMPGDMPPPPCVDTCTAIKSGLPHHRELRCE